MSVTIVLARPPKSPALSRPLQYISETLVLSIREIHECVLITQYIIDWISSIAFLVLEEEDYVEGYGSDDGYTVTLDC